MSGPSADERAYDRIVDEVGTRPGVGAGRILSSEGLHYRGKYFVAPNRNGLLVKLPADRVVELVDDGTGVPFETGRGRVMREWVVIRPEHRRRWRSIALEALAFAVRLAGPT